VKKTNPGCNIILVGTKKDIWKQEYLLGEKEDWYSYAKIRKDVAEKFNVHRVLECDKRKPWLIHSIFRECAISFLPPFESIMRNFIPARKKDRSSTSFEHSEDNNAPAKSFQFKKEKKDRKLRRTTSSQHNVKKSKKKKH